MGMRNDVSAAMFRQLDRLEAIDPKESPDELKAEISHAKAVKDTADVIIGTARVAVDVCRERAIGGDDFKAPKGLI